MRFVIMPGYVLSRHDGDLHFITEAQLRVLYRIPRGADCVVIPYGRSHDHRLSDDVICVPRYWGDYPSNPPQP